MKLKTILSIIVNGSSRALPRAGCFLAAFLLASGLPTLVQAQFSFVTNNGAITITGYKTAAGLNAVIPAVTNGYPVTSIGGAAFEFNAVTNVTIPNSVTTISFEAFEYCYSLTAAYFLGKAPPDDGNAFTGYSANDPTTVYYLAGTTGWGSTFGGVPAVLWNPRAYAPGFTGGQFGFNLTGPANAVIVVEACTNLANPVWLPVATNTYSGSGTSAFSDPQSNNYSNHYYRFQSQ